MSSINRNDQRLFVFISAISEGPAVVALMILLTLVAYGSGISQKLAGGIRPEVFVSSRTFPNPLHFVLLPFTSSHFWCVHSGPRRVRMNHYLSEEIARDGSGNSTDSAVVPRSAAVAHPATRQVSSCAAPYGCKARVMRIASSTAVSSSWLKVSILDRNRDLSNDRIWSPNTRAGLPLTVTRASPG